MRTYKVFDNDWRCKGFKFEVGKRYKYEGKIEMCKSGFHACVNLNDCYSYYPLIQWNKFAEVKLHGKILDHPEDSKKCTDDIEILNELSFDEIIILTSEGVSYSKGVDNVWGCLRCEGYKYTGKLAIFNKVVSPERFEEVKSELIRLLDGWSPTFNNIKGLYLASGSRWEYTPIPQATELSRKEAWAVIYLQTLPEYVKEIFEEITGRFV